MIEEKKQNVILSEILKIECEKHLISQQNLANAIGKSKQYVNFVLNGSQPANPAFVNSVLQLCGHNVRFNYSVHYHEKMSDLMDSYLNEYCYYMDDYYLQKVKESLTEEMYYSYACPEYLAMQCAVNYQMNNFTELEYWIDQIEKTYEKIVSESLNATLMYLIIKAEYLIDKRRHSCALLALEKAKEQASSSCIKGVIDLLMGIAEIHLGNYWHALECFQTAEKTLLECRIYGRTLAATKNIGSCYANLQQYEKSETYLKKALKEAKHLRRKDIENICYLTLCGIAFKQGDFLGSIDYGKRVQGKFEYIHCIYMAWSYYFLGDYDLCMKYRDNLKGNNVYFVSAMVELIDMYLRRVDAEDKISLLHKMIDQSIKEDGKNNALFCMEFLIHEYRKLKNYEKVAEYKDAILRALGYYSFFDKL